MLFNSLEFLLFFPVVVVVYFLLPHKLRWILLLLSSYYFYMSWKPEYAVLILIVTAVNYFTGLKIGTSSTLSQKKIYLAFSLIVSLGILFFFKYYNFLGSNLNELFSGIRLPLQLPYIHILLPVGISFFTFQTLSYTIDVYRGHTQPRKHFGLFALYVSFFPQLVAGPIERSNRLLPQFYKEKKYDYSRIVSGLRLMLWGFFVKIVIADRLAEYVNIVYNNPLNHEGFVLIFATVLFAFQIYCDFSAYSDIAIGAARVMGYDLMQNFNRPYFSKNVSEFWRRWHISLSSWFRDYVYIPLGGSRVSKWGVFLNLFVTFVLSGFWHGANWTFLAWGATHGLFLILNRIFSLRSNKLFELLNMQKQSFLRKLIQVGFTFSVACFAWIFFRANSISDAFFIIEKSFSLSTDQFKEAVLLSKSIYDFMSILIFLGVLLAVNLFERKAPFEDLIQGKDRFIRWVVYGGLLFTIFYFGKFEENQFIYFQF